MEKLQVSLPGGFKDRLKAEARAKGMYLQSYVLELLQGRGAAPIGAAANAIEAVDKRDPEVQQVIDKFEQVMGSKMPRGESQRRAAKTLLQRHGLDRVLRAIDAVAASRNEQYAPNIAHLVALRDKWIELENFYRRAGTKALKERTIKIS